MMKRDRANHAMNRFETTHGGFTITELLVAVGIVGILSAVALPNYTRSICKTKQSEVISEISMIQSAIMTYTDERGVLPSAWEDINEIRPITTTSNNNKTFAHGSLDLTNIQILRNDNYQLCAEKQKEKITFNSTDNSCSGIGTSFINTINILATPKEQCPNFDVRACIDTQTGVTDLEKGNGSAAASTNLLCN